MVPGVQSVPVTPRSTLPSRPAKSGSVTVLTKIPADRFRFSISIENNPAQETQASSLPIQDHVVPGVQSVAVTPRSTLPSRPAKSGNVPVLTKDAADRFRLSISRENNPAQVTPASSLPSQDQGVPGVQSVPVTPRSTLLSRPAKSGNVSVLPGGKGFAPMSTRATFPAHLVSAGQDHMVPGIQSVSVTPRSTLPSRPAKSGNVPVLSGGKGFVPMSSRATLPAHLVSAGQDHIVPGVQSVRVTPRSTLPSRPAKSGNVPVLTRDAADRFPSSISRDNNPAQETPASSLPIQDHVVPGVQSVPVTPRSTLPSRPAMAGNVPVLSGGKGFAPVSTRATLPAHPNLVSAGHAPLQSKDSADRSQFSTLRGRVPALTPAMTAAHKAVSKDSAGRCHFPVPGTISGTASVPVPRNSRQSLPSACVSPQYSPVLTKNGGNQFRFVVP
eukprot:TRINITY_DN2583_c0_g1_i10.p1 TRINITY_DN2583_c0_g1~~TRINITY_DN2583_c0_g1_i10.p1  ORF type:complete len:442 (+),score=58.89 TRINITY_DN2583_c0_g1_i10:470-1795(+)